MTIVTVIAEFGGNPAAYAWNFDSFCRAASEAGATHAKIQLWKTEHFPSPEWAIKRPLEFPRARLPEFVAQAHRRRLQAGASVFDTEAVELAAAQCDFLKLAAREQENYELSHKAESMTGINKVLYRSVSRLNILYSYWYVPSSFNLFTIQHYPTNMIRAFIGVLRAAQFFNRIPISWGWSSHSLSALDCVLAARLGASVIEKHLCLSRADPEGGHSLLPDEFGRMVSQIRRVR